MLGHPQIRGPRTGGKEQHFFKQFRWRAMTDADVAAYHEQFPRKPGQVAGEWTPRYMRDYWAPQLIHRAAPDAKLLVMLRDPIERYRSGIIHQLRRSPRRGRMKIATDAIERGRYASQLERLRELYPEEQMLVLQYEQCRDDPLEQFRRTLRFLGVDEGYVPPDLQKTRGRPTSPEKDELWPDIVEAMRATLADEVRRVATLVPDFDLSLWPNFSDGAPREHAPAFRISARPPEFVGVGVPEAGAERWQHQLLTHPDVAGPTGALHFFDEFCTRAMTQEDAEGYCSQFGDGKVRGEWTPRYALDAWTPALLRRTAPDARVLLMVRDPIERFRAHMTTVGPGDGTHPTLDPAGPGRYALLMRRLLEHFPRDQVLVLQTERCMAQPEAEYARTLRFLGVSDDHRLAGLEAAAREMTAAQQVAEPDERGTPDLWPDMTEALHAVLDAEIEEFAAMVPEIDLSLWPNFAHLGAAAPAR